MDLNIDPSRFQKKKIANKAILDIKMSDMFKALGICIGASTVTLVQVVKERTSLVGNPKKLNNKPRVIEFSIHPHEGDPKRILQSALNKLDLNSFDRVAATGRSFCEFVNLTSIPEPEAVEYAYEFVKPQDVSCQAVVSAGGETTMVYVMNRLGRISNVLTGNKCASGTGEFFLQQLRRMNVEPETAFRWAVTEKPHHVSGRCSVFCKSDCTHAINKGIPKQEVTAGLCKMMADKILELLKKMARKNIMIAGGMAQNQMMIAYLSENISGLVIPEEAPYFEALGAALWALENQTVPCSDVSRLFKTEVNRFNTLSPLQDFEDMVDFKTLEKGTIQPGDVCILGLDVGSTTTKAILLRKEDNAMLASIYLRTNGDPVEASRQCYRSILHQVEEQMNPSELCIEGLGVCGSGRQIAGLHALTDGVINEIIAHATAAIFFDPQVDTIFEIGGQDAKYTYITNSVASDYAMNEACSAGTGSFLEEAAQETLGVKMEDIAQIALRGVNPPNFNDQCAAFIASDIKNAIHEGVKHEDIIAGLVYSICMNYANRVKGNRPIGEKVFMQGGVCYNRAVPLAMASLVGKPIIVPPEPGLMGAFGVALEVKKRIENGLIKPSRFDLEVLSKREVKRGKSFTCSGSKGTCDRSCKIAMIEIEKTKYPFGGACNRYYNLRHNIKHNVNKLDLIRIRQRLIFEKYEAKVATDAGQEAIFQAENGLAEKKVKRLRGRIGINKSFLVNTYYPLYSTFFAELGFEPVVPDAFSQEGIDQTNVAFCYPGELAHGFFHSLLEMRQPPEFIFLPHFKAVPVLNGNTISQVCPFVQGETFYLQTAFGEKLNELKGKGTTLLTPLMDLTKGLAAAKKPLMESAKKMGVGTREAHKAFNLAMKKQIECMDEMKAIGKTVIKELEADPDKIAAVVFARPYNGFVEEAHMGIPHKLASRGIATIPLDFLPLEEEEAKEHMYWGMGQRILKATRFVKRHPQLFGIFITNFSCGPDSFIIGYFRDIMGRKPSLTLELDSHTADAGLETRIEAFLDIVTAYRQLMAKKKIVSRNQTFIPTRTILEKGTAKVITSSGETLPMTDPRVTLLIPSMGKIATELLASVFRGRGFKVVDHAPADETILKLGRANTSCKECLPLILTTGTLLNYIDKEKTDYEILVYFMPTSSGPCRFGQYYIFMEDLVRKLEIPNVALFSLTSENSYGGLGNSFQLQLWNGIVVSDVLEDIRSMLLANAIDTKQAMQIYDEELGLIKEKLEDGAFSFLEKQLAFTAKRFSRIPLKRPLEEVPTISLVGEIFVRKDSLSRQYLTARLARKGFATRCSPVAEWVHYSDYLVEKGLVDYTMSRLEKLAFRIRKKFMARNEKRLKSVLSLSGLFHFEPLDINSIIDTATPYISPNFTGEAILTIGSSLSEIASHTCGVIAIGPFGCMPNRVSEAILSEILTSEGKMATESKNESLRAVLTEMDDLPFLAIESDGSPFPQLIDAKLDAFCLRAKRLHDRMLKERKGHIHLDRIEKQDSYSKKPLQVSSAYMN